MLVLSSSYVVLLDYISVSSRSLQLSLVLIIIVVFLLYFLLRNYIDNIMHTFYSWILVFWSNVLVLLLTIATGGLQSPFFILLFIYMIALSFYMSFSKSLIYLCIAFIVLFLHTFIHGEIGLLFVRDPLVLVLQFISLIVILPVTYLISQQYHSKDRLFSLMRENFVTDEAILRQLQDMILVTDNKFHIVSVNTSTEQILQRSSSELYNTPLFDVLFLKDQHGKLITADWMNSKFKNTSSVWKFTGDFSLLGTRNTPRTVHVQVQKIQGLENVTGQLSFIVSWNSDLKRLHGNQQKIIDHARARYEVIEAAIRKTLLDEKEYSTLSKILLLDKIENDIYVAQKIQNDLRESTRSRVDVSQICRRITMMKQEFADIFKVTLSFEIDTTAHAQIASMITGSLSLKPDEMTGPFFTVACDIKIFEIFINKLLDLAILLSSSEDRKNVIIRVGKNKLNRIRIEVESNSPYFPTDKVNNLFIPYYGTLSSQSNLHLGSGLEGYIVYSIKESGELPFSFTLKHTSLPHSKMHFSLDFVYS